MFAVPFIGGYIFFEMIPKDSNSLFMASTVALYINGQLFFLGFIVEGLKYLRGKYKENKKVFWLEWVETTFSLWILGVIIIGVAFSFKRLS